MLADWILFSDGHLKLKKQVESCLKKLFSANFMSTNLGATGIRNLIANSFHFTIWEIESRQRELNCPRPRSQTQQSKKTDLLTHTDSSSHYLTLLESSMSEDMQQELSGPVEDRSVCCCGKMGRGKWIKCQTLVYEITRQ